MGRALFSHSYRSDSKPAVRSPSSLLVSPSHAYEKWCVSKPFDPDSDDFFQNAEYEAFLTPEQFEEQTRRASAEPDLPLPPLLEDLDSSSSSSGEDEHETGSPMAVGPDDPAILIDRVNRRADAQWEYNQEYNRRVLRGISGTVVAGNLARTRPIIELDALDSEPPASPFIPPQFAHSSPTDSTYHRDSAMHSSPRVSHSAELDQIMRSMASLNASIANHAYAPHILRHSRPLIGTASRVNPSSG